MLWRCGICYSDGTDGRKHHLESLRIHESAGIHFDGGIRLDGEMEGEGVPKGSGLHCGLVCSEHGRVVSGSNGLYPF